MASHLSVIKLELPISLTFFLICFNAKRSIGKTEQTDKKIAIMRR